MMDLCQMYVTPYMSKPTKYTIPRVNPRVNSRLWVIIMCRYKFILDQQNQPTNQPSNQLNKKQGRRAKWQQCTGRRFWREELVVLMISISILPHPCLDNKNRYRSWKKIFIKGLKGWAFSHCKYEEAHFLLELQTWRTYAW